MTFSFQPKILLKTQISFEIQGNVFTWLHGKCDEDKKMLTLSNTAVT